MKDLSGQKYGRWTVVSFNRYKGGKCPKYYWNCRCECGTERPVLWSNLSSGISRSCGCLKRESTIKTFTKHGMGRVGSRHPLYKRWVDMRRRCNTKSYHAYSAYGGRGIKVCKRWDDFQTFFDDMSPGFHPSLTLERRDVNGNYEPSNCCWATWEVQHQNTQRQHINP